MLVYGTAARTAENGEERPTATVCKECFDIMNVVRALSLLPGTLLLAGTVRGPSSSVHWTRTREKLRALFGKATQTHDRLDVIHDVLSMTVFVDLAATPRNIVRGPRRGVVRRVRARISESQMGFVVCGVEGGEGDPVTTNEIVKKLRADKHTALVAGESVLLDVFFIVWRQPRDLYADLFVLRNCSEHAIISVPDTIDKQIRGGDASRVEGSGTEERMWNVVRKMQAAGHGSKQLYVLVATRSATTAHRLFRRMHRVFGSVAWMRMETAGSAWCCVTFVLRVQHAPMRVFPGSVADALSALTEEARGGGDGYVVFSDVGSEHRLHSGRVVGDRRLVLVPHHIPHAALLFVGWHEEVLQ